MMKRVISTFLSICFLCVGLFIPAIGNAEEGRAYSEKVIDLPDGYSSLTSMSVTADGSIVGAAQDKQGGWALLTWKDGAATPEVLPLAYDGTIDRVDVAPDGQVMAISTNMEALMQAVRGAQPADSANQADVKGVNEAPGSAQSPASGMGTRQNGNGMFSGMNLETTVLCFNEDGTVGSSFTYGQTAQQYKVLSGRRFAVSGMQAALSVLDETGAVLYEIDQSNVQSLAATNDTLFVITRDGIYAYDVDSGEQTRSISIRINNSPMFYALAEGTLYYTDGDGVYKITPGADTAEPVMDVVGTLLGDPSISVTSFGVKPDGSIVALVDESGSGVRSVGGMTTATFRFGSGAGGSENAATLVIYTPIDASLLGTREEFLITALRSSNRLRKAVSDFQRAHPELKVTLQVQLEDDDDSPVEDHIRTLNTDLLAGKGGDVIILDGLPMEQYAARGILKDLSGLLPELSLLPGIASGLPDANGRVFSIPAQFSFQTLWGKKEDIELVQSLSNLVYANVSSGQTPMSVRTPEELFRLLLPSSEAALKDEQGKLHFNTPEFEEFLEALYELYANQGELPEINFPGMGARTGRNGLNITELLSFYNGATAFFSLDITGLMQITTAYSLAGGADGGFIALPSLNGAGNVYTPSMLVGVNATSRRSDYAVEFVRTMFSNDVQEMDQMSALPATTSALNKMFDDAIERAQEEGGMRAMMMIPGGISLEIGEPDEPTWNALRALCMEVDTPAVIDETLLDFILSETENFFDGRTSAAEAGQAVEQRAWYYLNE